MRICIQSTEYGIHSDCDFVHYLSFLRIYRCGRRAAFTSSVTSRRHTYRRCKEYPILLFSTKSRMVHRAFTVESDYINSLLVCHSSSFIRGQSLRAETQTRRLQTSRVSNNCSKLTSNPQPSGMLFIHCRLEEWPVSPIRRGKPTEEK